MQLIAMIVMTLLFAVAAAGAFTRGTIPPNVERISIISAGLAGMLMGVALSPLHYPANVMIGVFYSISFMLMVIVAALPSHARK